MRACAHVHVHVHVRVVCVCVRVCVCGGGGGGGGGEKELASRCGFLPYLVNCVHSLHNMHMDSCRYALRVVKSCHTCR